MTDNQNPTHDLSSQRCSIGTKTLSLHTLIVFLKRGLPRTPNLKLLSFLFTIKNKKLSIPFVCSSFNYCYSPEEALYVSLSFFFLIFCMFLKNSSYIDVLVTLLRIIAVFSTKMVKGQ